MTTLELVIGITLIALISSICFAKFETDNYKINSFAKQLCSDLRYVRREHMLNNSSVYIRFMKENNQNGYSLYRNKQEEKQVFLPKDTDLNYPMNSNNAAVVKFNRDGSFSQGGGTIIIKKGDRSRYITIVPVSGRILFKEGIYEK